MSTKTILRVLGLACVALFVIEILFDPFYYVANVIRIEQIRHALPIAKARWQAQGITDYAVKVRGGVPLVCMFLDDQLIVQHNQLVSVFARAKPFDETSPQNILATAEDWQACRFNELVISKTFERIEQNLQQIDPVKEELKVSFDETLGIVTDYTLNYGYGHGVFSPGFGECCMSYKFREFQVFARNGHKN